MEMSQTMLIGFVLFIWVGLSALVFGLLSMKNRKMADRLQHFVVDYKPVVDNRFLGNYDSSRELEGSLFRRVLGPSFRKAIYFLGRLTPTRSIKELNRKLLVAGNPMGMRAREFTGLQIIFFIMGSILALFSILVSELALMRSLLIALLIICISLVFPLVWLRYVVSKAQTSIRKSLPDALDMLSVCASAGLGFDQALQKVSDTWRTPIGTEFHRVVQEMEVGLSRTEALRNMSERLQISEISSFVAMIVQAEHLGMQIADVLHSQAEQMRILRQFHAKEIANRLPAKMIMPLALCVLPALIAVILGPMIPVFLEALSGL
jgi:tight adherence protein C